MRELLERYGLYARARGFSDRYIEQVFRSIYFFDDFLNGNTDISKVTADDFRRFLLDLRDRPLWGGKKGQIGQKLSGTSQNTYARAIKAFFSWAKAEDIIAKNLLLEVAPPRKPKMLPKVYSENELRAIFMAAEDSLRNQAILYVFLDTGIRLKELSQINLVDVDMQEGIIKIFGKGGKERLVYFNPVTADILKQYINNERPREPNNERLFLLADGHSLSSSGIQSLLERIGRKAGIKERLAPHKLRHTWATLSLKYGGNLEYIRKIMGHTDIKTTSDAYLNARDEDIQDAHRNFSPIANLYPLVTGKESLSKNVKKSGHREEITKTQSKQSARKDMIKGHKKTMNTKHGSLCKLSPDKRAGKLDIIVDEERHDKGDLRLHPFHLELYREHLRKLAELTGEIITDIENNKLEPLRWVGNHEHKTVIEAMKQVYHAQNNSLWPFLLQHLNNELLEPPIQKQLEQIAARAFLARFTSKTSLDSILVENVCERLVLLRERGTFVGKCKICEDYFYKDSEP